MEWLFGPRGGLQPAKAIGDSNKGEGTSESESGKRKHSSQSSSVAAVNFTFVFCSPQSSLYFANDCTSLIERNIPRWSCSRPWSGHCGKQHLKLHVPLVVPAKSTFSIHFSSTVHVIGLEFCMISSTIGYFRQLQKNKRDNQPKPLISKKDSLMGDSPPAQNFPRELPSLMKS